MFSQGFFSSAQVSGSPNIESLKFIGYDATNGPSVSLNLIATAEGYSEGQDTLTIKGILQIKT